jgi:REP element-mobilizing transposase RayT
VKVFKRRLPHLQPSDADFFVTWRLYGSLPNSPKQLLSLMSSGEAFVAMDRQLDRAATGPLWLKEPRIAECVSQILQVGASEWQLYDLQAWVIMANHVHVLLRPKASLGKILMNVKSASARQANRLLSRTGQPFWQDESYDHWVRNDRERSSIIRYIHLNPVKAGLVTDPIDWPWSSASRQRMAPPHINPTGQQM